MIREAVLTEEQWARIEPLLPTPSSRGRPWRDNRAVFEGSRSVTPV
jgi:transposase